VHCRSLIVQGWLALAQLLPAWASELAESKTNAGHIERDLKYEDIINGRLDDAGPPEDGRRLGLRLITPDNRAGYLEGAQARELLAPAATPEAFSFISNRLLVMKEAVLDFARRHGLPQPSWWGNATGGSQEGKSVELTNVAPRRAPITPAAAVVGTWTAPRPRKGPAPGTVDRFGESDRALFPEIERIMREGHETVHAAALELASARKIQGGGTPES
jgi:hypothetical protein